MNPLSAETNIRPAEVTAIAERLLERLRSFGHVVVAFSGGVDSSVVAAAAAQALGERAIAMTADSPSVPRWQLETARRVAAEIGINHQVLSTAEVGRDDYRRNDLRRCYYCKETLYGTLRSVAAAAAGLSGAVIVSGTNADDLGDHRPGIEAGRQAGVRAPLAELGIDKSQVRDLARRFGLANAALPASPCLASRVAYGVEVTPERLARIESAEAWLRQRGFSDVRVRLHADELARVEVPAEELPRLFEPAVRGQLDRQLRGIGFRFVTVDAGGLRSGSLNPEVVSWDTIGGIPPGQHEAPR